MTAVIKVTIQADVAMMMRIFLTTERMIMHIETIATHAGRAVEKGTGAVTPSITLATTFEREADGSFPSGFVYTRSENPNRQRLEEALAALEGGAVALAFASGMAATAALLQTLQSGDHIVMPTDLYHGSRDFVNKIMGRWGLQATAVDMRRVENVVEAIRPNTRLIWIESPTNPSLNIADITAIAGLARERGILTAVDNTWATPILQRPLELGADIVMHSTTKYFGGHSDVLGGALILGEDGALAEQLRSMQLLTGGVPAPFDCWLLLRSIATMPLRVRAQTVNAAAVAQFLDNHPAVNKVHYPGLASHDNHAIAVKQMIGGFGAMVSFEVGDSAEAAMAVAAKVNLITRATSLGGVESLIEHRASIEGPDSPTPDGLLRLSVGLEHIDDLLADLAQALGG
jgi:cystathionine gamma-synthase